MLKVYIIFHSDIAFDDMGSRIHIPKVVAVRGSRISAGKYIDKLLTIPAYSQNIYYYTEYEVDEEVK